MLQYYRYLCHYFFNQFRTTTPFISALREIQKQSPGGFLLKLSSYKFHKIHRKIHVSEYLLLIKLQASSDSGTDVFL